MGGKVSSPKCQSLYKYGGHAGAVVLENNYALKQDTMDRPAYVMGYVNTFAVEKYQVGKYISHEDKTWTHICVMSLTSVWTILRNVIFTFVIFNILISFYFRDMCISQPPQIATANSHPF